MECTEREGLRLKEGNKRRNKGKGSAPEGEEWRYWRQKQRKSEGELGEKMRNKEMR